MSGTKEHRRKRSAPASQAHLALTVAAAAWAALFGALHLAWMAGSRITIADPAAAEEAFGQAWFQIYNAVVAVGSFVTALCVFALLDRGSSRRRMYWWIITAVGALLLLRAGIGLAQLGWLMMTVSTDLSWTRWTPDLYMLLGAALLLSTAQLSRPKEPRPRRVPGQETG